MKTARFLLLLFLLAPCSIQAADQKGLRSKKMSKEEIEYYAPIIADCIVWTVKVSIPLFFILMFYYSMEK